jgi:hypothetical protein
MIERNRFLYAFLLVLVLLLEFPVSYLQADSTSEQREVNEIHEKIYQEHPFPSAVQCMSCHQQHYREWSVSQHAYAMISPVFNAMQGKVIELTNGTNGDFCIRCHTPIGMLRDEPLFTSFAETPLAERELPARFVTV